MSQHEAFEDENFSIISGCSAFSSTNEDDLDTQRSIDNNTESDKDISISSPEVGIHPYDTDLEELLQDLEFQATANNISAQCFQNDPETSEEEFSDLNVMDPLISRVGSIDWCMCKNCIIMPTAPESVCCIEFENAVSKILETQECITEVHEFKERCLHSEHLQWMLEFHMACPSNDHQDTPKRLLRKAAYRSYTRMIHGFLGKHRRIPIPSCVVHLVRCTFPDEDGLYMGFIQTHDYPATDMAMDI
ncbi:uncharacterized protein [Dendropsophus ebraccatus]|uniref:uncharacterized protein n=1 Tax=Dendropsophus ebraccatus TaxID=150705 RepID=UPI0038315852